MHYHMEVVMPPTDDVKTSLEHILTPFSENYEGEDAVRCGFWDWYEIGGRYSGSKIEGVVPPEKLEAFYAALKERHVTVSGIQFGKQEISPSDQIPMVDALWREMCPESGIDIAPMFQHARNIPMDVCAFSRVPDRLHAYRVIVAAPDYKGDKLKAVSMFAQEIWNGCNYEKTDWGGAFKSAMSKHIERISNYKDEYAAKVTPQPDWLVITVDYHS